MNFIPKIIHGLIDYILSLLLIALPFYFNLSYNPAQGKVTIIAGCIIIVCSLLTNYKLGPVKLIPFKIHLVIDVLTGLFLAVSPWLFQFSENFYFPHVFFGGLIAILALLTDKVNNQQYF